MSDEFILAFGIGCFAVGFSLATLLICRVTVRPIARKALQNTKLLPLHRAKIPGQEMIREEYLDLDDYE